VQSSRVRCPHPKLVCLGGGFETEGWLGQSRHHEKEHGSADAAPESDPQLHFGPSAPLGGSKGGGRVGRK